MNFISQATEIKFKIYIYPQNPFRSIYACKRMPSAYPDDDSLVKSEGSPSRNGRPI